MRINESGNVGLGVASPAAKLDVAGNLKVTGNATLTGSMTAATLAGNGSAVTNVNAASLDGVVASSYRNRGIVYLGGCDTCSALTNSDNQNTIYYNVVGAMTITDVKCFSDAGNPTINLQRNDGTPADILSGPMSCSTTGGTNPGIVGGESVLN